MSVWVEAFAFSNLIVIPFSGKPSEEIILPWTIPVSCAWIENNEKKIVKKAETNAFIIII
jgi:hypothetical protein